LPVYYQYLQPLIVYREGFAVLAVLEPATPSFCSIHNDEKPLQVLLFYPRLTTFLKTVQDAK
jgi:hypothetical protein